MPLPPSLPLSLPSSFIPTPLSHLSSPLSFLSQILVPSLAPPSPPPSRLQILRLRWAGQALGPRVLSSFTSLSLGSALTVRREDEGGKGGGKEGGRIRWNGKETNSHFRDPHHVGCSKAYAFLPPSLRPSSSQASSAFPPPPPPCSSLLPPPPHHPGATLQKFCLSNTHPSLPPSLQQRAAIPSINATETELL